MVLFRGYSLFWGLSQTKSAFVEIGWYSPNLKESSGSISIEYWNGVVNKYSPRGRVDPNDASLYTLEHYLASLKVYLDECEANGKRAFVDIPIGQVWDMNDWEPASWLPRIVDGIDSHRAVAGYYMADEPEIWGYREANSYPVLEIDFMQSRYQSIKRLSSKPVLVVFADVPLLRERYGRVMNPAGRFFDIFGFDYYPFLGQDDVRWDRISSKLEAMGTLWQSSGSLPVFYAGQGCGDVNEDGKPNFGQRNPTSEELDEMLARVKGIFGEPAFYMLWSWQYADSYMRTLGNVHLESVGGVVAKAPEGTWIRRLINRLLGL